MIVLRRFVCLMILAVCLSATGRAEPMAQATREQPFKTVHLMAVASSQEAGLRAAVDDMNNLFRREGCIACRYHVLRMFSGSQSPYNVMVYADWPSPDAYLRIHKSAAFSMIYARNPVFGALEATQFYGKFVEIR